MLVFVHFDNDIVPARHGFVENVRTFFATLTVIDSCVVRATLKALCVEKQFHTPLFRQTTPVELAIFFQLLSLSERKGKKRKGKERKGKEILKRERYYYSVKYSICHVVTK